jgi:hypothetical protein
MSFRESRLLFGWRRESREAKTMSEKSKRAIILAISTLLKGGMEYHRVVQYIHTTYCLNTDEAEQLVTQAQTRLHLHYVA